MLKNKDIFWHGSGGAGHADGHGYYLSFLKKSGIRFLETGCPPGGGVLATQVAEAQRPDSSVFETTRPLFEILLPGRWRRRQRTANGGPRAKEHFEICLESAYYFQADNLYGLFLISK